MKNQNTSTPVAFAAMSESELIVSNGGAVHVAAIIGPAFDLLNRCIVTTGKWIGNKLFKK